MRAPTPAASRKKRTALAAFGDLWARDQMVVRRKCSPAGAGEWDVEALCLTGYTWTLCTPPSSAVRLPEPAPAQDIEISGMLTPAPDAEWQSPSFVDTA